MNLLLAQIERQTRDTKTLRFQIPKERRFSARPGQFLTFKWAVDGHRMTRSYTISSSPIHGNYVEITPKRMENGCVSVFLNEQAKRNILGLNAARIFNLEVKRKRPRAKDVLAARPGVS